MIKLMKMMMIGMIKRMMVDEGNDGMMSDGSSLLLSLDHHETSPFHVLLLFYDCDPFITLLPPLPLLTLSFPNPCCVFPSHWCLPLLTHRLSFYWFVGWVLPFPVASKQCVKEALVCCQKNPFKEHVHDFIVALQGYILYESADVCV